MDSLTPAITAEGVALVGHLTEIVRWATANLDPEFIRDTPAAHYRAVAMTLASYHGDAQLAGELADVFNMYAERADAWVVRRGQRGAEVAPACIVDSPYPIEVAAAYSMKTQGNAGIFDGARRGASASAMRKPGLLTRAWRWLF